MSAEGRLTPNNADKWRARAEFLFSSSVLATATLGGPAKMLALHPIVNGDFRNGTVF
jgi:hypothetical protein